MTKTTSPDETSRPATLLPPRVRAVAGACASLVLTLSLLGCGGGGGDGQVAGASDAPLALKADAPQQAKAAPADTAPYVPAPFQVPELKQSIYESVLTGNGLLGTATYRGSSASVARVDVGRTDSYDHGPGDGDMYFKARLPVGHFDIELGEKITRASGVMQLHDGHALASYTLANGNTAVVKTRTLSGEDFIIIEVERTGGSTPRIDWKPEKSISPRTAGRNKSQWPAGYGPNPDPQAFDIAGGKVYSQPMLAGGAYGVGYKSFEAGNKTTIIVSTFYSQKDANAKDAIEQALQGFDVAALDEKIRRHELAWHQYYAKSTYRMPDTRMQAFYDMQLYKLASAARAGGPAIDLQGPWTSPTPWPGYWMNLNIQLTYSPLYTANRLELASTLVDMIEKNKATLIANAPSQYRADSAALGRTTGLDMARAVPLTPQNDGTFKTDQGPVEAATSELGNLTWTLYYYYQHYRYSMDAAMGQRLFDILKRSVQYGLHLTKKNAQGRYEFAVKTFSPEYPNGYDYNTNYDVSILKWGLKTLISLNTELGMNDPDASKWKDYLDKFIDYPRDATGYRLSTNMPFAVSHRHYSHLFMIYPFYLVNWDQVENRSLIETSINTWKSKRSAFQGYSWTGLASMQAMMGQGDTALASLQELFKGYIQSNTLYKESGPVIETPLSMMTSLQELSLQYWDGVARVFPAVPSGWKDLSFDNFRTEGAFLISGRRANGINQSVTVVAEKGGTIRIKPNLAGKVVSSGAAAARPLDNGIFEITLAPGQSVTLEATP